MPTDTKLNQLIINQLTQEQYDEAKAAGTLSDTELYITDSDDDPQVKSNLSQTIDDSTTKYPSNKAVKDESSRITTLMDTKVSNCITYIPQDIKLELNNGTLTLKTGSKVYIPNGFESDGTTKKFDVVTTTSDLLIPKWNNTVPGLISMTSNRELWTALPEQQFSGSSAPTTQYALWYDTTNNIIKSSSDAGSSWKEGYCLPMAICTADSSNWTSINQVFNGFGYIGSTDYALPGVKGLIPNGRNADGSLKNIEFTTTNVAVFTRTYPNDLGKDYYFLYPNNTITDNGNLIIQDHEPSSWNYMVWFDTANNLIKYNDGTTIFKVEAVVFASSFYLSGKISSFTPKTVFHALDYNDKSTVSGWSMPSSRYIDLSVAASGSTYTAPANGYFSWYCYQNNNGYIFVQSSASLLPNRVANASNDIAGFIPVKKGDIVMVEYANLTFNRLRFIYAEGEPYNPVSSSSKNHGYIITDIPTQRGNDFGDTG